MDLKKENIRLKDALDREVQENMLLKDKAEGLQDRIDSAINYIQSASRFELEYDKKFRVVSKYEEEYILREKDIYKILKGDNK